MYYMFSLSLTRTIHLMRKPTIITEPPAQTCSVPRSWLKSLLPQRVHLLLAILSLSLITPLLTACGGDTSMWRQADTSKTTLAQTLQHALAIGVPAAALQSIQQQYTTLANTNAPIALFNNQSVDDYYQNITSRYR